MGGVRRRPLGRRITLWCRVQILGMEVPPFVRFGTDRNGGDEGGSTNAGDKDDLGVFHDVRRRCVCVCARCQTSWEWKCGRLRTS